MKDGLSSSSSIVDIEQAGAICLRRTKSGEVEVLLVCSRRSGRWGLPKGHIEADETSYAAAEREAFEEAGARGIAGQAVFGRFTYFKDGGDKRYTVIAHLLETRSIARAYP